MPAIILCMAVLLCMPLILGNYGFLMAPSDGPIHLVWAQQFARSVFSGVFLPGWAPDVNAECGSPTFLFYPPLTFYTYTAGALLTDTIPHAMALSLALGMALSGVFFYLFMRLFADRTPSALAACLYMASPYHIIDLYYRSFLAEYWAFAWIPLVGYFLFAQHRNKVITSLGLAVSYALCILTHLPTALLLTLFLPALIAYRHMKDKAKNTSSDAHGDSSRGAPGDVSPADTMGRIAALGFGICLSAYYTLPPLFEQGNVDMFFKTLPDYQAANNFIFSASTTDRALNRLITLAAIFSLPPALYVILRRRHEMRNTPAMLMALIVIACFLLMSGVSAVLWRVLPLLNTIQYPFRLLTVASFAASVIIGLAMQSIIRGNGSRRLAYALTTLTIAANLALSFWVMNEYRSFYTPSALSAARNETITPAMGYREMRPKLKTFDPNREWFADVLEYRPRWSVMAGGIPVMPAETLPQVSFIEGQGHAETLRWDAEDRRVRISAGEPGRIMIKTFYYPGWRAEIDGKDVALIPHPESGLIMLEAPMGDSALRLWYASTRMRHTGAIISVISLALFLLLVLAGLFHIPKHCRKKDSPTQLLR